MNRIRELRTEKRLTQAQLAQLLGVNQTAVGKYEREELEPNIQILIKLSHIFEVSIDYITGNSDDFGNITVVGAQEIPPAEMELLADFRKLPDELRHRAQAYMKRLAELASDEAQTRAQAQQSKHRKTV